MGKYYVVVFVEVGNDYIEFEHIAESIFVHEEQRLVMLTDDQGVKYTYWNLLGIKKEPIDEQSEES